MTPAMRRLLACVDLLLKDAEPWPREGNVHLVLNAELHDTREALRALLVEQTTAPLPKQQNLWKMLVVYLLAGVGISRILDFVVGLLK